MGRVFFSRKAESEVAEGGPVIDWREIEARLREISAPPHPLADLPIAPLVTLANDPPEAEPASANYRSLIEQLAPAARGAE